MDLQSLWFLLIGILFIGYFILEGFDFGVGILLPFLGKDDDERRLIINTIGPFWDGNEVWVITAGGAMFAAFPNWYATLFSGFYLALLLLLVALIARGVAFEFRSKDERAGWRSFWDWMIFFGSVVPALLWGVAMANLLSGVPIDAGMNYVGGFLDLLSPFTLLGGLAALSIFTLSGAIYLSLRASDPIAARAHAVAKKAWIAAFVLVVLFALWGFSLSGVMDRWGAVTAVVPLIAAVALLLAYWFLRQGRDGWAFAMTSVAIAFATLSLFVGLYPSVMVSSLNPDWSLTVYNASSGEYTLKIMTVVALIFVPIVLIYQGWTYHKFWERLSPKSHLEY